MVPEAEQYRPWKSACGVASPHMVIAADHGEIIHRMGCAKNTVVLAVGQTGRLLLVCAWLIEAPRYELDQLTNFPCGESPARAIQIDYAACIVWTVSDLRSRCLFLPA